MTNINKSKLMSRAWYIYNNRRYYAIDGATFFDCLTYAWAELKTVNVKIIASGKLFSRALDAIKSNSFAKYNADSKTWSIIIDTPNAYKELHNAELNLVEFVE